MKKFLIIGAVLIPLALLMLMKVKKNSDIKFLIANLQEHYGADKVSVFRFYKDGDSPINLGLDYTHMQCIG